MPRYFFHVVDRDAYVDQQGTPLKDLRAARREAMRFAGALLQDDPDFVWRSNEWMMRVTDERDMTLFELRFLATAAASTFDNPHLFIS